MDDILNYLETLTYPDTLPPEYFTLLGKEDPFYKTIQETLSLKFLDQLQDAQSETGRWERREAFSRGFRLGARLILAALAVPSALNTHRTSSARRSASPRG